MNRIYLPYPIEVFIKIVSWLTVITIDLIELALTPFMHIGAKCFAAFAMGAAIFSGYVYFSHDLLIGQAFYMLGALLAAFLAFVCFIRLVQRALIKVVRPLFANVIFAPVAVSFRRPCFIGK